jgi:hypothetical protein
MLLREVKAAIKEAPIQKSTVENVNDVKVSQL